MVAKKFMYACVLIVAVHSLGGCPARPPVNPNGPDASDASVDADVNDASADASLDDGSDSVSATCARSCKNLQKFGCPEGNTPDGGDSCVVLCQKTQNSGKFDLKPSCISKAVDMAGIKACKSVRCMK